MATHELKRLPARFYRTASGREPVREWLKRLEADLLHGFIKKSRKTPKKEIDLALKRMKGAEE